MPRGLFEPMVMFFGLTNSPATFQAMMDYLFRELITLGKLVIYLDDILIFTKTLEEHRKIIRQVLQILRDNHLYLKPEKCDFEQNSVEYLGMIIGQNTITMDPKKIKAVEAWPIPTKKRDLQSFIGFCNFYRRFIQDFSKIARPLHDLTKLDVPFKWGDEQQESFDLLKKSIIEGPTLMIPIQDAPFRAEADSSDHALGGVLSQQVEGKWKPVAFLSKSLNAAERNYKIHKK